MRGPKPVPIELSEEERQALEALVRRKSTGQQVALSLTGPDDLGGGGGAEQCPDRAPTRSGGRHGAALARALAGLASGRPKHVVKSNPRLVGSHRAAERH